jgi:hypothetical protein
MFRVGQTVYHRDGKRSGTVLECHGDTVFIEQANGAELDFSVGQLSATPPVGAKPPSAAPEVYAVANRTLTAADARQGAGPRPRPDGAGGRRVVRAQAGGGPLWRSRRRREAQLHRGGHRRAVSHHAGIRGSTGRDGAAHGQGPSRQPAAGWVRSLHALFRPLPGRRMGFVGLRKLRGVYREHACPHDGRRGIPALGWVRTLHAPR